MREEISIVLAGIGGYGKTYLRHLLDMPDDSPRGVRLVAVADPLPDRCPRINDVRDRGIPIFPTLESFYEKHTADLAIIVTPVQLHARHVMLALSRGSHVLCEKPLASSLADVASLIRAREQARRHVAIGYQWSFCPAIRALKRDVAAGLLGRPLRMRTLVLWPRGEQYYRRNSWAGALRDPSGLPVLDSPLNNACAHFVHNAFYVLGDAREDAAYPTSVTAELYRVRDIGNYDTGIVRCTIGGEARNGNGVVGGVEAMFIAAHPVPRRLGPVFRYEFEEAVVTYDDRAPDDGVVARFRDGTTRHYGVPCSSDDPTKLWDTIERIRTGRPPTCGIEAATAQTALICAAQKSSPRIGDFPPGLIRSADGGSEGPLLCPDGLEDVLVRACETMSMPSELPEAPSWAVRGQPTRVEQSPCTDVTMKSAVSVTVHALGRPAAPATAAVTQSPMFP
jgi:predicted dehydrogenase